VQYLTNGEKLPVVVFCACSCGDFDYMDSPLAWEFMKQENGGAIACIASTNPSYIIPSTLCTETVIGHLTMTFYKAYSKGMDILGDIWQETIVQYMNNETAWDLTPLNWKIYNVSVKSADTQKPKFLYNKKYFLPVKWCSNPFPCTILQELHSPLLFL
jgi:hypothetical protein